jgi:hypothetical protein
VSCVTDIFLLQAVEKKCAALPTFFLCKRWRRSELRYRHFFTASGGEEVSCVTDIFSLQAVEKK